MRIGHGYDAHQFIQARPLILCGILIPHSHGLKAHSDGDVAIHALCDAILGAAALGDIGQHFPDNSKINRNRSSQEFLTEVDKLIKNQGYKINNIDLTIILEKPKLTDYVQKMRKCLSNILKIELNKINIKATTTESLGFTGREEGIAAHAVALLAYQTD